MFVDAVECKQTWAWDHTNLRQVRDDQKFDAR